MARKAGRAYQEFKARIRIVHAHQLRPCALCTEPIDYQLRYPHPQCWSLDHRVALHQGGNEFDPLNAQASHLVCNQSRGASEGNARRKPALVPQHTSKRW